MLRKPPNNGEAQRRCARPGVHDCSSVGCAASAAAICWGAGMLKSGEYGT